MLPGATDKHKKNGMSIYHAQQCGAVPADRAKDADLQLRWYNGFPEVLNQSIVYLSKQSENQIFQLTKAFKVSKPEIP